MAKNQKVVKKRKVVIEATGQAHIQASFNNVIVTLTNKNGEVISWSSAGKMGFRGSKKNTPYAAQVAAQDATTVAYEAGLRRVKVFVKGPGQGRESAIRTIHNGGIEVSEIVDVTPLPHNGCRPLVAPIALEKGTKFAIREGGRTVGAGVISEIIK